MNPVLDYRKFSNHFGCD